MTHYWGAQAICERIGYSSAKRLPDLIRRLGVPAFKRRRPKRPGMPWYSNSELVLTWELARVRQTRETLIAQAAEKQDRSTGVGR